MSGIEEPGAPPPEVPEEFAAAYRDAYRRALADQDAAPSGPAEDVAAAPGAPVGGVAPVGPHEPRGRPQVGPPSWRTPGLVALLVVVLLGGAFGTGRLLSSSGSDSPSGSPALRTPAGPGSSPNGSATGPPESPNGSGAPGSAHRAHQVVVSEVVAGCTSKPAVDSAGHPVSYAATNVVDGKDDTAWRCDGTAVGTKLVLTIPAGTEVVEVGLIPGYAKTDPKSGIDRYAENNRISRVRWTLGNGVVVDQTLDPDPTRRALQRIRTPRTATGTITLEILAVVPGPRNTTAISEVFVGSARS